MDGWQMASNDIPIGHYVVEGVTCLSCAEVGGGRSGFGVKGMKWSSYHQCATYFVAWRWWGLCMPCFCAIFIISIMPQLDSRFSLQYHLKISNVEFFSYSYSFLPFISCLGCLSLTCRLGSQPYLLSTLDSH